MYAIKCESCKKIIEFGNEKIPKDKRFAWVFCPHCGSSTLIIDKGEPLYENEDDQTLNDKEIAKPKKRGRRRKGEKKV